MIGDGSEGCVIFFNVRKLQSPSYLFSEIPTVRHVLHNLRHSRTYAQSATRTTHFSNTYFYCRAAASLFYLNCPQAMFLCQCRIECVPRSQIPFHVGSNADLQSCAQVMIITRGNLIG